MNLRLARQRRRASSPAKLRYAREMLQDLSNLLDTVQERTETHLLCELVTEAEREARRQLAQLDAEPAAAPGRAARQRVA